MPKLHEPDPIIEAWIEQNTIAGKMSTFKTIRLEADLVNVYPKKVDGVRYGSFGIHIEHDGYHVTHCRTGGMCGVAFTSEKQARRFIFCILGLTAWHKIEWPDTPPYLRDHDLLLAVKEAHEYCAEINNPCTHLLALIKPLVSGDAEEEIEPEPVAFGSEVKTQVKKQAVAPTSSEKSGWGVRITA